MTQKIRVGKFHHMLVDDEDYHYLRQFKWYMNPYGYAYRKIKMYKNGILQRSITRFLHDEILPRVCGLEIDHINRNRLDNRIDNMRYVTSTQNKINSSPHSLTGLKGVSYHDGIYVARMMQNSHELLLGRSREPLEMAYLYDLAMLALYPEYAWLNCEHYNTDC